MAAAFNILVSLFESVAVGLGPNDGGKMLRQNLPLHGDVPLINRVHLLANRFVQRWELVKRYRRCQMMFAVIGHVPAEKASD
ncbi:uncharacterized protein METZ01_LOCUS503946, partial [marine metagenome]